MKNLFCILFIFFCLELSYADTFTYHWEIDETPSGQETFTPPEPIEVEIEDTGIKASVTTASAGKLANNYGVYLSHEWDPDKAYALETTMNDVVSPAQRYLFYTGPSYWTLSEAHIPNDILFETDAEGIKFVTITSEAFTYANPFVAKIDGVQGRFFSRRLHKAILRFFTDNCSTEHGREIMGKILHDRYAVACDGYGETLNYLALTRNTTRENASSFTPFKPEEMLAIASMFEEYPSGMLKTPGLKYLLRRQNDVPHPTNLNAAAVAWTRAGYIEFMYRAFEIDFTSHKQELIRTLHDIQRLILHEKAHFLWTHLFDDQLKQDWIELGGWFQKDGEWFTTKQLEFVSAYAHGVNPNEDMAESISFYIVTPNKLRTRAPAKYEFIQNRIMHGTRYISKIREDLTFQVYNLFPDYVYPGQIVRVDIKVEGAPEEHKYVTVEVETHTESNLDFAEAIDIYCTNLETGAQLNTIALFPINEDGNYIGQSYLFRGKSRVSKYNAAGYYMPSQITFRDPHSNARHQSSNDFGWQLYINNTLEDLHAPEYVPNSAKLSLSDAVTNKGEPYQIITATWRAKDDIGFDPSYNSCSLRNLSLSDYSPSSSTIHGRARIEDWDGEVAKMKARIIMPHYKQGGEYQLRQISLRDVANNRVSISLRSIDREPPKITIKTDTPDAEPPTLDINNITINARPTVPEAPNGETIVSVRFFVKDDISGYEGAGASLRSPLGDSYGHRHRGTDDYPKTSGLYFQGDPNIFRSYTLTVTLPVGSAPGIWGLESMSVWDKAENTANHDFTEIVRFEVQETPAAPNLVVSLPTRTELLPNYPNPFNPETWIPYTLSEASDVKLVIFNINGTAIKSLDLGLQAPGFYTSKAKAAYWDGRNSLGESVATGVYFYKLETDRTSNLKKMVILK